MKKAEKVVVGDWRITSMEMWDADYFDMEVLAHITIYLHQGDDSGFTAVRRSSKWSP